MAAPPTPPDVAGPTIRDLLQQLGLTKPLPKAPPPRLEGETAPPPATATPSDGRMTVKAIHITGITVFSAAELEAVVAFLVGGDHTLAELNEGVGRITTYYHEHGYVVARAYLPPQEIRNGEVMINVLEGHIGNQIVNNQSRLSDQRANDYLRGTKSGDVLQAGPVDRQLFLLNEMPGVGAARAVLQPGASVGTADLIYDLATSDHYVGNIELDNYGSYYTGEYRLGAQLMINSPLKIGDQLTLRAMASNQNLLYGYAAYQMPVGRSGLRMGAAYFNTNYSLGKDLADLNAHGTATSSSLFAVYPFIRSFATSLSGTLTLESKKLVDTSSDFFGTSTTDKQVRLVNFGLNGRHQDARGGGGITSFDLSLVKGRLSMDENSLMWDSSAQSNGSFTRMPYNINRMQRLRDTDSLLVALSGQIANKNLNSSEKFSLGGVNGVRAYPQGEASGDLGWMTNLELRHSFAPTLQGVMFYDSGSVQVNKFQYLAGSNTRHIAGAGVGVNANLAGGQIKAFLAWRTSGSRPVSEPPTLKRNPRFGLQLSWDF